MNDRTFVELVGKGFIIEVTLFVTNVYTFEEKQKCNTYLFKFINGSRNVRRIKTSAIKPIKLKLNKHISCYTIPHSKMYGILYWISIIRHLKNFSVNDYFLIKYK